MINTVLGEFGAVILIWLIQSYHMCDAKVTEYLKIVFWSITVLGLPWNLILILNRSHKCDELPWYHPV